MSPCCYVPMLHVKSKKGLCRHVDFRGLEPSLCHPGLVENCDGNLLVPAAPIDPCFSGFLSILLSVECGGAFFYIKGH